MTRPLIFVFVGMLACNLSVQAQTSPQLQKWMVDGVERQALVALPAKSEPKSKSTSKPIPVVFVFHGHGGSARNSVRTFRIHQLWPEAAVVCPQGLPTPGKFDPEGKRAGWQKTTGDQGDRDLKFFDTMLTWLKTERSIDENRVYATGHSNGGAFTYLLWSARPDIFAAFAPSAAGARNIRSLKPMPVMHIAGEKDTTVPFATQKLVMNAVRELNGGAEQGEKQPDKTTLHASKTGAPFVTFIHPGDHKFPNDAPPVIVRFFKEQVRAQKG